MTQWAYAIVDEIENLENIKKAMESEKFNKLMSLTDGVTGVGRHRYNRKVISTFRKDFWKEFLD
jgi:type II restriction/modification system DNA methylase subunit YeeA